jgi:Flp pilus assembly pilin Flp
MWDGLKRFAVEDSGMEMLEWAIVAVFVALALAPVFALLSHVIQADLKDAASLYDR